MPLTNAFSIDESMVPCYGRHGCTQFIKGKPIRFGFKIWACATVSGYCIQLEPYPGVEEKSGTTSAAVEMLSTSLVRSFVKIFQKHLSLFMDKYFTLLSLLEGLKNDLQLIATGTQEHAGFSILLSKKAHCPSEEIRSFRTKDGLKLTAWWDNKVVMLASTRPSRSGATKLCNTILPKRETQNSNLPSHITTTACGALI